MTKTFLMVRHKNYNSNANEGFVMFLTSKLITCFIDDFTSKRKSQSIAYYSMEDNIYIGFWTLTMKCTQHGLHGLATFKNPRVRLGSGWAMVRACQGRVFSGDAPSCRLDACNTCRGYLESMYMTVSIKL